MDSQPGRIVSPAITDVTVAWFMRMMTRLRAIDIPGWFWVVLLWALFAFPAVALRGTHYEEGTVIGLARGAVEDGHWLSPHLYGERFIERPVLLSWLAAATGSVLGVSVWSARIPHLLFLLGGGLLVFHLIRPLTRTPPAVFGALCWFASPMVAQKFITAEPDVTLSVLLFGAFVTWWNGAVAGQVSARRWLVVATLLVAAGLTKGPQPLGYFALGVGAYLLVNRQWRALPGFIAANLAAAVMVSLWYVAVAQSGDIGGWISHSRLSDGMSTTQWLRDHFDFAASICVEWLPGSLMLGPVIVALYRGEEFHDNKLLLALILYAGVATLALLLWPGGVATRYAMPANLALAAMSGILFERWWTSRAWLIGTGNTIVITIAVYLVVLGAATMPMLPDAFRQTRTAAHVIEAVRSLRPGLLHVSSGAANTNVLAYVTKPIRVLPIAQIEQLVGPALVVLTAGEVATMRDRQPNRRLIVHAALADKIGSRVVEISPD